MLGYAVLCVMVALCAAQTKTQYAGLSPSVALEYNPDLSYAGASASAVASTDSLDFQQSGALLPSLPVEVAPLAPAGVAVENWAGETLNYPAPSLGVGAPTINLPKGSQEVVDIPHAAMPMPGNSIQNKDLHLNLPSPTIEAPNPIIRKKDVLFRLPQPIFYVPNPIVQHKPIVHRVPHTLRTITPRVNLQAFLFKVPSAQITGKSGY